ncbi:nucleolin [Nematocida major]|uniref:nucleolin n=1 Tax=Nematocida major TaxID=1912982 RepID=UPI0020081A15|nr:nucleolin [Nematocida major]KAH9387232.1 nucleolin [Nematocida major]
MAVRKTQTKKEEEEVKKVASVEESNSEEVTKEEASDEKTASEQSSNDSAEENSESPTETDSEEGSEKGSDDGSDSSNKEEEAKEPEENKDERTIFIKGITFGCTEESLKELFGKYGNITEVRIPRSRDGPGGKGFGYVEFESKESCEKARELDGTEHEGRIIVVDMAKSSQREPRADGQRGFANNRGGEHTVFLGNIPFDVDHADFIGHLKTYADVTQLRIPEDRETGRPKGFAFASVATSEEAQKLINSNITYMDRSIRAQLSEKRNNNGPRGGSFGGRDNSYGRRDNERAFGKRSWASENSNNKRHVKFE